MGYTSGERRSWHFKIDEHALALANIHVLRCIPSNFLKNVCGHYFFKYIALITVGISSSFNFISAVSQFMFFLTSSWRE